MFNQDVQRVTKFFSSEILLIPSARTVRVLHLFP